MPFSGFSIPDGAFIPVELIYLLPHISGAKLKVLIAVLINNLQIGSGEPSSLKDIEDLTGLSRQSVITALRELLSEKILERQPVGGSFVYSPVVKFLDYPVQKLDQVVQKLDYPLKLRESESQLTINFKNSLTDSLKGDASQKIRLVQRLRSAGVYLKTAQGIVEQHDEATIEQQLDYYLYALGRNLAQGPGWLVMSLKENWQAPIGYTPAQVTASPGHPDTDGAQEAEPDDPGERSPVRVDVSVETVMANSWTAFQAWTAAKSQIKAEMPKAAYEKFMQPAELVSYENGIFRICAHNAYARDWLDSRLSSTLHRLLTGICNQKIQVEFCIGESSDE